jgi:hypothetical protein
MNNPCCEINVYTGPCLIPFWYGPGRAYVDQNFMDEREWIRRIAVGGWWF